MTVTAIRHRVTFDGVRLEADPAATAADVDPGADPIVLGPALALPWGQTVQLNWWGDTVAFAPGSVTVEHPDRTPFLLDHTAHAMGYGVDFAVTPAGLVATVAVPREELADPATARAVRQMGNGVRTALSVGVVIEEADETDGAERGTSHFTVTAGRLVELSSVLIPRFDDARHGRVAAADLEPDPDPDAPDPDPDADPDADTEGDQTVSATALATVDPDADRAANHRRAVTATAAPTATRAGQFATFGDYVHAAATGAIDPVYRDVIRNALADALVATIPGLMPEAWISDVVDLMGSSSATVQAFRQVPLPDHGMTVNMPVIHQGPDVGVQATEKTAISTRVMQILPAAFPVKTYAGGQDVSIQAIARSSPAYLDVLMRAFVKEMAIQLDLDAAAAVVAAAAAHPMPLSAADFNGSFVDAAALLLTNSLAFPDVAVFGVDIWTALAKAEGTDGRPLFPTLSPVNPVGSFNITQNDGNVRGLTYYVDPLMAPTAGVLGVRDAFVTMAGGVATLTADVPAVLGRDVAVYQFAAMGATDTRGLVGLTLGALTGTRGGSGSSSSSKG